MMGCVCVCVLCVHHPREYVTWCACVCVSFVCALPAGVTKLSLGSRKYRGLQPRSFSLLEYTDTYTHTHLYS
jgi:hypothetical protein